MLGFGTYLWRLVPANPILLRVVETGGKRKRDLIIRCAYLGALLFVVIALLLPSAGSLANASLADLSKQSGEIFLYMSYLQLALVALLAPIFTAGAITQEKDSQTYDILLSTPLSNAQIVLGSLLSRLFFVIALLISGIPIFSITQIFGGVAISSIVMSFLIAAATAFVTGALAMAIAVLKVGTRRTIFSFYLLIMLYLAIPLALEQMGFLQYAWQFDAAGKPVSHISWFAGIHPFLALKVIFGDPAYSPPELGMVRNLGWPLSWYLSSPQTFYVTLMFVISFVLVTPSIILLRRLAQSQVALGGWFLQKLRLSSGDKTRRPRRVWSNPIAWREAKTRGSANRSILLRYGFMLGGVAAAVVLAVLSSRVNPASTYIGAGGLQADDTVTIFDQGQASVYRVRQYSRPGMPATGVLVDGKPASLDDLRSGMVVKNIQHDPNARERVLMNINLTWPQAVLAERPTRQFLLGAVVIELAVILLILTQSAASTVTREKEDGTLDLLLATPITSHYYIWGKLRGLVSFVLPLLAVPVLSVAIFVMRDLFIARPAGTRGNDWTVFPEAIIILPATLVMICAFAAILGMQMSLRCRRTVVAVMSSVGIVGGICGGLFLCGSAVANSAGFEGFGMTFGAFSPFTLMSFLVNLGDAQAAGTYRAMSSLSETRLFVFFGAYAAATCYGLVVWTLYRGMVRNFDMTIRKQAT